jgi:hypothetical protein
MAMPIWVLAGPGRDWLRGNEVSVACLVDPAPTLDVLSAEVAEVRDRSAEGRQAEPQRNTEDLEH